MIYELTELEYKFAKLIGSARHNEAEKTNRAPDWKDGTEKSNHIDGAAAEILAAKALNVYYCPRINTFKGADIGKNIEVRGTKVDWYGVKVKERDSDERIVVGFRKIDDTHYDLLGWIAAKEAKKKKWMKDPMARGRPAYFVPQEFLNPVETFPKEELIWPTT